MRAFLFRLSLVVVAVGILLTGMTLTEVGELPLSTRQAAGIALFGVWLTFVGMMIEWKRSPGVVLAHIGAGAGVGLAAFYVVEVEKDAAILLAIVAAVYGIVAPLESAENGR